MTSRAADRQDAAIPGRHRIGFGAAALPQWMTGIGCIVLSLPLLGWLLDLPVLRGFGNPHYAVAPLSAINGCSVTLAAFLAVSGHPRLARLAAAPAAILLSLITFQYLTGAIAIERLFFFDAVQRLGVRNDGLSPGGTVAVQALGGLAALALTVDRRAYRVIGIILASGTAALTLLATAALVSEPGGISPAFLGRSAISSALALLPAAGLILHAMRHEPNERGWHLLIRLAPAIIILPAIPSLLGFAAYQADLLGFGAAQFAVLAANVVILAGVLMRAIGHADTQSRALAIREAKLSAVLTMVPDAVILVDEEGTILDFSAAAERLWGYRAEQVVGEPVILLAPPSHAERTRQELADLRERELSPWNAEPLSAVGQRSDGSLFPLEARAGRVQAQDMACLTIFVRDMSAQFGVEDQIAQLNAELAHLARQSAMGEAAADLAHELNQPLTAAANYLSAAAMLARSTGAEGPGTEMVDHARAQVMQAGEIIRRLRSFTERNDTERSVEPLRPMIEDAARLVLVGSSRLAAQIDCDVAPVDLCAFVDRVQVQQVLVNLMRNAVEALRASGQRDPRIWVTARRVDGAMIELRCRDNGPGLPPETLAHLFQRFSASRTSAGMGIGLSISKRIIELHGGVFSAENAPEGGAIFVFTLPTLDEDGANARQVENPNKYVIFCRHTAQAGMTGFAECALTPAADKLRQFRPPAEKPSRQARPIPGLVQTSLERRNRMIKLKLAALLAAGAIAFGGGAALAAPAQQDQTAPKAQMARRPHHSPFDKDGMITRDAWMKAAAARFERFDVNKDGKISRQELRFGRFEERMHRRHRHGWQHGGPHRGPGFGPGREGPGGPHRRFGPPPPAGQPAPAAPAAPAPGN